MPSKTPDAKTSGLDPNPASKTPNLNRPKIAAVVGVALVVTVVIGGLLRWLLAGVDVLFVGEFAHVRHAHSHLGYYGVLFPLAWWAWHQAGAQTPGRRTLIVYAVATVVAFVGFVRAGYGPEAIVGSTIVGGVWLLSAWGVRGRMRRWLDPLGAVPAGIVVGLACIPPIAIYLRRDPPLSQAFVATFLASLLFLVVVPSTLSAMQARVPWPALLITGIGGSAALGVLPNPVTRLGLGIFAVLLAVAAWRTKVPLHVRLVWTAVAVGAFVMAVELVPNERTVVVGAIHFLVLSPILSTLAPPLLTPHGTTTGWHWWVYHSAVALLTVPLVAMAYGAGSWAPVTSAIGGTLVIGWWLLKLAAAAFADSVDETTPRP